MMTTLLLEYIICLFFPSIFSDHDQASKQMALRSICALVVARDVDGMLLRTANDICEEHLAILENAGIPSVVIKRQVLSRAINCVLSEDFLGAQLATTHLLQRGHRRIAFVCATPALTFMHDRMAGYRDALATAGIVYNEHLVILASSFSDDMGYRAVWNLLQRTERPTAIFAPSDTMAEGGYRAARALGLRISEDVTFVGYDDIAPAALLQPPLTTVRTTYYDFGGKATELLLDVIDGQTTAPQRVVITPVLIVRASTSTPTATLRPVALPQRVLTAHDTATMVVIGRAGPCVGELTTALADTGVTVLAPAWRVLDDGMASAVICVMDGHCDIQETLAALMDDGESSARALAKHHGGTLVLVALGSAKPHTAYLAAAVYAGCSTYHRCACHALGITRCAHQCRAHGKRRHSAHHRPMSISPVRGIVRTDRPVLDIYAPNGTYRDDK